MLKFAAYWKQSWHVVVVIPVAGAIIVLYFTLLQPLRFAFPCFASHCIALPTYIDNQNYDHTYLDDLTKWRRCEIEKLAQRRAVKHLEPNNTRCHSFSSMSNQPFTSSKALLLSRLSIYASIYPSIHRLNTLLSNTRQRWFRADRVD